MTDLVSHPVAALDIGGTWTRAAVVTSAGTLLARAQLRTPEGEQLVAACARMVEDVRQQVGLGPGGVGVSVTGPVDPFSGTLFRPPNATGLEGLRLGAELSERLASPVFVDRDTNAAALAERAYGAGRGTDFLVYLTLSTGVGGAVIQAGELLRGVTGVAGEIGHVVVDPRGPVCGCGRRGCLEAIASGPALARSWAAQTKQPATGSVDDGSGRAPEGHDVSAAAAAGDRAAIDVLANARTAFVSAVVDLVNVFNPARVVVGGSVALANRGWIRAADRAVRAHALEPARGAARVVAAQLGDDGGLLGAALLVPQPPQRESGRDVAVG